MPSPFADLLLQVIHHDPALPTAEQLTTLDADAWQAFSAAAVQYRLAHQLGQCLRADPARLAQAPASCLQRLDAVSREVMLDNLVQQQRLRTMLAACRQAGIRPMLIKGLWLVELAHRNIMARSCGDIDLLLRPEDMPRFTALARTLGFAVPPGVDDLRTIAPGSNEFTLYHPLQQSQFDIHWSLTHPLNEQAIDEAALWQRAESVTLAGVPCLSPGVEDHLLYLCFHAVDHHHLAYVGPRAMLDIAMLIARPPRAIDWTDFLARAQACGWEHSAWLMLDLIRRHLGVQPPPAMLTTLAIRQANSTAIHEAALATLFLEQRPQLVQSQMARMRELPSVRARAVFVLRHLFPSRAVLATQHMVTLDTANFYGLYARRLLRLIRSYLPAVMRLLRRDPVYRAELARTRAVQRWLAAQPGRSLSHRHQGPASPPAP